MEWLTKALENVDQVASKVAAGEALSPNSKKPATPPSNPTTSLESSEPASYQEGEVPQPPSTTTTTILPAQYLLGNNNPMAEPPPQTPEKSGSDPALALGDDASLPSTKIELEPDHELVNTNPPRSDSPAAPTTTKEMDESEQLEPGTTIESSDDPEPTIEAPKSVSEDAGALKQPGQEIEIQAGAVASAKSLGSGSAPSTTSAQQPSLPVRASPEPSPAPVLSNTPMKSPEPGLVLSGGTQVETLQAELMAMQEENTQLRTRLSNVLPKARALKERFDATSANLKEAQATIEAQKMSLAAAESTEEELRAALNAKDMAANEAREAAAAESARADAAENATNAVEASRKEVLASLAAAEAAAALQAKAEEALAQERASSAAAAEESSAKIAELTESVASAEQAAVQAQRERESAVSLASATQASLESLKEEFEGYKSRASALLASKEGADGGDGLSVDAALAQLDEARQATAAATKRADEAERNLEMAESAKKVEENARKTAETAAARAAAEAGRELEAVKAELATERSRLRAAQKEAVAAADDAAAAREAAAREKRAAEAAAEAAAQAAQRREKNAALKAAAAGSTEELEERLRAMADHLINKQTALQTLAAEKAALELQVAAYKERGVTLEDDDDDFVSVDDEGNGAVWKDEEKAEGLRRVRRRGVGEGGGAGGRIAPLASLIPRTPAKDVTPLGRRVVPVADAVDSLSVGTAMFLRRYPGARLAFLAYLLFLHLWVFWVLAMVTPEAHSGGAPAPGAVPTPGGPPPGSAPGATPGPMFL